MTDSLVTRGYISEDDGAGLATRGYAQGFTMESAPNPEIRYGRASVTVVASGATATVEDP